MAQQLNLLNLSLRRVRTKLNATTMLMAAAAIYAAFSAWNTSETSDKKGLEARKSEAETRLTQSKADLEKSTQAAKKKDPDKRLIDDIAKLELKLQVQREVLTALETGGLGNSEGFARYIAALARQRVEGVWLTKVGMNAVDNQLTISGRLLSAELLPQYIKALNRDEALRGRRFGELKLTSKKQMLPAESVASASSGATGGGGGAGALAAKSPAKPVEITVLEFELGAPAKAN